MPDQKSTEDKEIYLLNSQSITAGKCSPSHWQELEVACPAMMKSRGNVCMHAWCPAGFFYSLTVQRPKPSRDSAQFPAGSFLIQEGTQDNLPQACSQASLIWIMPRWDSRSSSWQSRETSTTGFFSGLGVEPSASKSLQSYFLHICDP